MISEFTQRMRVISRSPVRVFVASYQRRYWYPYILQHAGKAFPGRRDECLEYILDSGITNEELTNEEVLDRAAELDATYVVPKDYLHEQEATTESVREFLEVYEQHECSARPLVPLQPPYAQHYEELGGFSHYVLGGIAQEDPAVQLRELRGFRDAAGYGPYAHGLGLGCSLELVKALRADPGLLDSLDVSTPEQVTMNGVLPDRTWNQQPFAIPSGEDSSTIRGAYSLAVALQLNYMLGPMCSDDVLAERYQESLADW